MTFAILFLLCLILIIIIFFQVPKDNIGLTSFGSKTNFLGSPTKSEKNIKIITIVCILGYLFLAFELNF